MERYTAIIIDYFVPELKDVDVDNLWFQQDATICHTANDIINLLKEIFGECLISRRGPVACPPKPCILTTLNSFL